MQNETTFQTRPIAPAPFRVKAIKPIKKRKRRLSKRQKTKLFKRYLTAFIFLCGICVIAFGLYLAGKKTYEFLFTWPELDHIANMQIISPNSTDQVKVFQIISEQKRTITMYNAGDPAQTDASPCISASGDNICELIAQGTNVCASNWVKLGTMLRVEGLGECIVLDRMASRYSDRVDWAMPAHKKQEAIKFGAPTRNVQVIVEK